MSQPQTSPRPYATASARPEFVRVANRIAGQHRPLRFEWNGQPAEFSFTNLHSAPRGSWVLSLSLGGHALSMEISRLPELAWLSPTLAGIDVQGLPPELACGLLEASFGEIFTALSKSGIDIGITSVEPFSFRNAPEEFIEWTINRGSETNWMHGSISGEDAALAHLADIIRRAPAAAGRHDVTVPVTVHLAAGRTLLKLGEMETLEVHDVLFAELLDFSAGRQCALHAGGRLIGIGSYEGTTFTLKQLTSAPAKTMGDAAHPSTVNDIEIELTFVAGHTTMTVGELRGLAPGYTLELPTPIGEGLAICANGKTIGKGELIEIGGHLGVRITELSAS